MTGHLAQACTYPRHSRKEREAHGRKEPAIANVRKGEDEQLEERILEVKKELHVAEMRIAAGFCLCGHAPCRMVIWGQDLALRW